MSLWAALPDGIPLGQASGGQLCAPTWEVGRVAAEATAFWGRSSCEAGQDNCKGDPELLPLSQHPAGVATPPDTVHPWATEGTELEMLESNRRYLELRSDSRCVDGTLGKEPGNPAALGHKA